MIEKTLDPGRIKDRLQLRAIQMHRPLSCTLELTYRCNFHCRMCYIRMTDAQAAPFGRMRTVEEWLDMARQLFDAGVLYLTLTGGECTRYPGFARLYERLAQMGFRISIMSNAGAYSDEIRDVFRRYPPISVGVTLYGGSSETYAAVTGDPHGLDRAVENIRFFRSIRVPVGLNFTVIRQNVSDYPKVAKLCRELDLPCTLITDITGHRYCADYSEAAACRLSPAERACLACFPPEETDKALEEAGELEKELARFRMPAPPAGTPPPERETCNGSFTGCAIYWNGEMGTCISLRGYHNARPFETGFEAAWAQLKAEEGKTFLRPPACAVCGMAKDCLHNCAGRRFEGTGSPGEPDPYTCQYVYLLELCKKRRNDPDTPEAAPCS